MKKILASLLSLTCVLALTACGGGTTSSSTPEDSSQPEGESSSQVSEPAAGGAELRIGQVQAAAHGTKCFTTATVVTEGGKILLADLDEYQVMDAEGATGVPNSDADFGTNFPEGKVLVSKKVNNELYSANMAKSGSTITIADNMKAVEAYAQGKTVAELEELLTNKTKEEVVEAVAGCTLVDADGYLKAVVEAAKAAETAAPVAYEGALDALTINKVEAAAHGTKCFTTATVVTDGEKIVLGYLDEYQVMDAEGATGVPNSDADFGTNFPEGKVLVSKKVNNELYSANMAKSGSTISIADNMMAVEAFAQGKTVAELEELLAGKTKEEVVEAVAGCTLVDADGYLRALVEAAK